MYVIRAQTQNINGLLITQNQRKPYVCFSSGTHQSVNTQKDVWCLEGEAKPQRNTTSHSHVQEERSRPGMGIGRYQEPWHPPLQNSCSSKSLQSGVRLDSRDSRPGLDVVQSPAISLLPCALLCPSRRMKDPPLTESSTLGDVQVNFLWKTNKTSLQKPSLA